MTLIPRGSGENQLSFFKRRFKPFGLPGPDIENGNFKNHWLRLRILAFDRKKLQ